MYYACINEGTTVVYEKEHMDWSLVIYGMEGTLEFYVSSHGTCTCSQVLYQHV